MPLTDAVALRKESVDRNRLPKKNRPSVCNVALRKESVDRNIFTLLVVLILLKSLSARRAWIEIAVLELMPLTDAASLSARRAWIEIAGRA